VAFVDHDGAVLGAGDASGIDALDDCLDLAIPYRAFGFWDLHMIGAELFTAPFVEVMDIDAALEVAFGDEGAEPSGEGDVEAEDEDGFAQHFGEVDAAVAEDERFAGACHAMDDAVTAAEVAGELLLFEIEDAN
jgi:hypothetical protein